MFVLVVVCHFSKALLTFSALFWKISRFAVFHIPFFKILYFRFYAIKKKRGQILFTLPLRVLNALKPVSYVSKYCSVSCL